MTDQWFVYQSVERRSDALESYDKACELAEEMWRLDTGGYQGADIMWMPMVDTTPEHATYALAYQSGTGNATRYVMTMVKVCLGERYRPPTPVDQEIADDRDRVIGTYGGLAVIAAAYTRSAAAISDASAAIAAFVDAHRAQGIVGFADPVTTEPFASGGLVVRDMAITLADDTVHRFDNATMQFEQLPERGE